MRRRYCRRYGLDPSLTFPTRRELIADAAFERYEADGNAPPDRLEALLSAIYFIVLAKTSRGDREIADDLRYFSGLVDAIRPIREPESDWRKRKQERRDAMFRAQFQGFLGLAASNGVKIERKG